MNIKKIILNKAAERYFGLAVRKLQQLEWKRAALDVPLLKTTLVIDGVYMLLYTTEDIKKIIMWGGTSQQILLTDHTGAWAYNYYTDNLSDALLTPSNTSNADLSPIYNGRSQLSDLTHITFTSGWSSDTIDNGGDRTYLGGVNLNEVAFFASGPSIYGRSGDDGWLAVVLNGIPTAGMSGAQSNLFGVITDVSSSWNLANSSELITINPSTNAAANKWIWVPNFYRMVPGSGVRPGWFYGERDASPYDAYHDLLSMEVRFKGLLDCRYVSPTMLYKHGYSEMVVTYRVNDSIGAVENVADLYIFASQSVLTTPASSYEYYQVDHISQNGEHAYATMGDVGLGAEYAVRLVLDQQKYGNADVDVWSFEAWEDEESPLYAGHTGAIGVAVTSGKNAAFYRYKGYATKVYESSNYHSHIIDRRGSILCVMEGSDVITSIKVFDLFGTRDNEAPFRAGDSYSSGGFTEIRTDVTKVLSTNAATSCVIPYRDDGFTADPISMSAGVLSYTDTSATLPSMASMRFSTAGRSALYIDKITIDNSVATLDGYVDECFASVIVLENDSTTSDYLVAKSTWVNWWRHFNFSIRGKFTEAPMRFNGVGEPYATITLPDWFTGTIGVGGELIFDGYVGELSLGSCTKEGNDGLYYPDHDGCSDCGGDFEVTATSSCGQTAGMSITGKGVPVLVVTASDDIAVGDFVSSTGGSGAITYGFTGGSIDQYTGEILSITSCPAPGDLRTGTVSAADECGNTDDKTVRLPGGAWVSMGVVYGSIRFACSRENNCVGTGASNTQYATSGGVRWRDYWKQLTGGAATCTSWVWAPCLDYTMTLTAHTTDPFGGYGGYVNSQTEYHWLCP